MSMFCLCCLKSADFRVADVHGGFLTIILYMSPFDEVAYTLKWENCEMRAAIRML